jgi:hypothetical protein
MKCKAVQHRLLAIANPERVPAALRNHLAHCSLCREWHNQLILLERHIPFVPVPRSNGKANLIRRLLREKAPKAHAAQVPTVSRSRAATLADRHVPIFSIPSPRTPLRRRNLLLGAAATLLLIALGWFGLRG